MPNGEYLRTWRKQGFSLSLWDVYQRDEDGKSILRYRFTDRGQVIFEGFGLHCSPMHAIDFDESVYACLSFFTVGLGDTDDEYFDPYTKKQLAWRDSSRREELNLLVYDLENQD